MKLLTCELTDGTIALAANQLLDGWDIKDGVRMGADLDTAVRVNEDIKPPLTGQIFSDNDPLGAVLIVYLQKLAHMEVLVTVFTPVGARRLSCLLSKPLTFDDTLRSKA